MPVSKLASLGGSLLACTALVTCLSGCAAETIHEIIPPTMAPEQSISEACRISGEQIDRLTLQAEQQVKDGLATAWGELSSGKMPSLDFLGASIDGTLADVEAELVNEQVLSALGELRTSLQELSQLSQPQSLLEVPGYLGSLTTKLGEFSNTGKQLQTLCVSQ